MMCLQRYNTLKSEYMPLNLIEGVNLVEGEAWNEE